LGRGDGKSGSWAGARPHGGRRALGVLLLLGLAALGCDRSGAPPLGPGPRGAAPDAGSPQRFAERFLAELPALLQDQVEQAAPQEAALEAALAEPDVQWREPAALRAVAAAPGASLRFTGRAELNETGAALLASLQDAASHGLDPAQFGVERIEFLRGNLARDAAARAEIDLPPLSPAARALVQEQAEALGPERGRPEARASLLARLLAPGGPDPGLATALERARAAEQDLRRSAAALDLALADGLLHYARVMGRGNTKAEVLQARRQRGERPEVDADDEQAEEAQNPDQEPQQPAAPGAPAPAEELPLVLRDAAAFVQQRLEADLRSVKDPASLAQLLRDLEPHHLQYGRLRTALARYRQIVADGGWPEVKPASLRPGKSHPRVAELKARLAKEGFLPAGEYDTRYDDALEQAVRAYQESHQMDVTGRPHAQFWKSLNISAERRLKAIEITLQRWRETAIGLDPYYVFVNIPDFHVEVWKGDEVLLRKRVVAGESRGKRCDDETETVVLSHATPIQSADLELLVFAPYWNVTRRIKESELDPERGKDPLYYERNGYEVMRQGTPREWVREMPGPANSLGFVKFIFPNPHATFMHDTPVKELFRQPVRAYSHGCMRVQEPWDLAEVILKEDKQWREARFKRIYDQWTSMDFRSLKQSFDRERYERLRERANQLETMVYLNRKVPVHVEYFTVRVDDAGQVHFLSDVYRYDEERISPRRPKRCVPETKAARRDFARAPRRVEALQRKAVELTPRVLQALERARTLDPKGPWEERHLLKQLPKLQDFGPQHENLAQRILAEHASLATALEAARGRWRKPLLAQAVRLQRLMAALEKMNGEAAALSRAVERRTAGRELPGAEAQPPAAP